MTARKVRVYLQGVSAYVIGTEDVHAACAALGITAETHRWASTGFGPFVRRQGRWRATSELYPPKDASPGVCFYGPIKADPRCGQRPGSRS